VQLPAVPLFFLSLSRPSAPSPNVPAGGRANHRAVHGRSARALRANGGASDFDGDRHLLTQFVQGEIRERRHDLTPIVASSFVVEIRRSTRLSMRARARARFYQDRFNGRVKQTRSRVGGRADSMYAQNAYRPMMDRPLPLVAVKSRRNVYATTTAPLRASSRRSAPNYLR